MKFRKTHLDSQSLICLFGKSKCVSVRKPAAYWPMHELLIAALALLCFFCKDIRLQIGSDLSPLFEHVCKCPLFVRVLANGSSLNGGA